MFGAMTSLTGGGGLSGGDAGPSANSDRSSNYFDSGISFGDFNVGHTPGAENTNYMLIAGIVVAGLVAVVWLKSK